MRCRSCGKEIEKYEVLCDECKEKLKNASSREELKELERLIEENKNSEDLEMTKELTSIENIQSDTQNKKIEVLSEIYNDNVDVETMEEENISNNNEKNQKKLLIIIISIILFFILIIVGIAIFTSKNKEKNDNQEIDYNEVIKEYGSEVENILKSYETLPTWDELKDKIKYDSYLVVCSTHEIYEDKTIYLSDCKVNEETIKYTYGKKQEEKKSDTVITIYKQDNAYNITGGETIGSITCKNKECGHYLTFDNYEITKENEDYYIYNYNTNKLIYGPFKLVETLNIDNELYGLIINDGTNKLYNIKQNKLLKSVTGTLELGKDNENSAIYKYGYVIFKDDNKYNFVNLKTGNISYYVEGKSLEILTETSNLLYMISLDLNDKYKVINSNGKQILEGDYTTFNIDNEDFMFYGDKKFAIYDKNMNVKVSSNEYDKILKIDTDYIVVLNKNHLEIVDKNDKSLAKFTDEWNTSYEFDTASSGVKSDKDGDCIYLIVINKSVSKDTLGYIRKYYYNKVTKKMGLLIEAN